MDTVLSIQVLCAVGDVKSVMKAVWKLLKPGGYFIFWEHERNKDTGTALAQGKYLSSHWRCWVYARTRWLIIACLNPAWSTFLGCSLNRDIKADIIAAGEWENPGDIEMAEEPYSCLPRIWGVLKKKAWLKRLRPLCFGINCFNYCDIIQLGATKFRRKCHWWLE